MLPTPPTREASAPTSARSTAIRDIKQIDFYVDDITGKDKTLDLVVDIFNRVNSGGSKLFKGDLALAKICAAGVPLPGGIADPKEEALLREVHDRVQSHGLPAGELAYELCDSETGAPIAMFDFAWPEGLQPRLSRLVALC